MQSISREVKEYNRLYNVNMFSIDDLRGIIDASDDNDKYDVILNALKVGYTRGHNDGYIRATREAQPV